MTRLFAGVDIGSTNSKACVIDLYGKVIGYAQGPTGADRGQSGYNVFLAALEQANADRSDICCIGATGYGRRSLKIADVVYPEVICHARGAEELYPGVKTVLDVGGQDCKIIQCLDGQIIKFEMNDKCAAGTGRFYEVLSEHLLKISLDDLSNLALRSQNPARISSMCTVFAESEIISMLSQGVPVEDICRGIIVAMFRRIRSMAGCASIPFVAPLVFMGGVGHCKAAKQVLEEMLGIDVIVPDIPQMPAALGVACIARDDYLINA